MNISSSSKIMVDKYVGDHKRSLSVSRDVCMNRQETLFLKKKKKKTHQKLAQLGCLQLTCVVRRNGSTPVSSNSHHTQTELDAGESEAQELSYQAKTVHVRIQLQKECSFGEQFFVVGDDPMFGLWEPSKAVPLNWSDGHIWTVELDIPIGKSIQFKFILKKITGTVLWQPGPDRVFRTWVTEKIITVCEDWDNAELQKILEEEPAAFGNSNMESGDSSGMVIVADILSHPVEKPAAFENSNMESGDGSGMLMVEDILSHPVEKPVSRESKGSTSAENESTMVDKPLAETSKEEVLAKNLSLEEKPVAIVAENIGSSYDNPFVNSCSKALHSSEVINTTEGKEVVSTKNTSMAHNVSGNNCKTVEDVRGNMIYHVGDPVLVPGLTPLRTKSSEASIPYDDPKGVDESPSDYPKSITTFSEKQQSIDKHPGEFKDQNAPELDGTQKDEDTTHKAETAELFIEQEQPHHEIEERPHLAEGEIYNSQPSDNNVLHNDIQWGRITLHKLLSNLGLL